MFSKARLIGTLALGGFFVCLDQYLKRLAQQNPLTHLYLLRPWLGFEYFKNTGVAFSLPIPQWLVLWVTPFVLFGLGILLIRSQKKNVWVTTALLFILAGAISNYIDRALFGGTIDYIRVFTGVINIADVMIAFGFTILLVYEWRKTNQTKGSQ